MPSRRPDLAVPGMVGRDRDLSLLDQALNGRPGLVVVAGEAGIGKTRLVLELLRRRGETALVAVCPPFREPYTLGPVVDAVRRLAECVASLPLTGLAGALRPVFPEWVDQLPPAPEPLADAAAARHRLLRALIELIDVLDVGLLVLEDAHWADETTLELLLFLRARWERGPRLILTYRPEDVRPESLLRRLLAQAGVTRLEPRPLDTAATAQLVSSMLGGEPVSEEFAELLRGHTDGLPLAIEESVRLLYDRADLVREDGAWLRRDVAELDVPPSIREAVLERTSRLGRAAAQCWRRSPCSRGAGAALIAEVAGVSPQEAENGLIEALPAGYCTRTATAGRGSVMCWPRAASTTPSAPRSAVASIAAPEKPSSGSQYAASPNWPATSGRRATRVAGRRTPSRRRIMRSRRATRERRSDYSLIFSPAVPSAARRCLVWCSACRCTPHPGTGRCASSSPCCARPPPVSSRGRSGPRPLGSWLG
ncbi:AAA family ATPase [Streptomyces kaempferi]